MSREAGGTAASSSELRLPHFAVVGAAKSGTTALHHYLGQHPAIFLPDYQEPSYFAFAEAPPRFGGPDGSQASVNRSAITSLTAYAELYRAAGPGQVLGDVSPVYLYWPPAAEALARHLPRARIVAVLRHPVDRAFSAYMHARREGKEPLADFTKALAAEPDRLAQNWGFLWRYADLGRYPSQLQRYYDRFPPDQIKVFLYEDLQADPVTLCRQLFRFTGVDPEFTPDVTVAYNVSGVPRSRVLQELLQPAGVLGRMGKRAAPLLGKARLQAWARRMRHGNLRRRHLDPAIRISLLPRFEAEIGELERLINRDLSTWRAPQGSLFAAVNSSKGK